MEFGPANTMITELRDEHAEQFADALPELIGKAVADRVNPDKFARLLDKAAREIESDGGESRYERQRRETSLRTWTDKRNGMLRISGSFDPLSGVLLNGRLSAAIAALFTEKTPSTCPTDPGLKQDHLRALALLCLTAGSRRGPSDEGDGDPDDEWSTFIRNVPSRFGRPEIVVVLDARAATVDANDGKPVVDWGIPVELPARTLEELFQRADLHPVIMLNGVVLHAPGLPTLDGERVKAAINDACDAAWRAAHPERAETVGGHDDDAREQRLAAPLSLSLGESA